jgi:hypothetical protein
MVLVVNIVPITQVLLIGKLNRVRAGSHRRLKRRSRKRHGPLSVRMQMIRMIRELRGRRGVLRGRRWVLLVQERGYKLRGWVVVERGGGSRMLERVGPTTTTTTSRRRIRGRRERE